MGDYYAKCIFEIYVCDVYIFICGFGIIQGGYNGLNLFGTVSHKQK